MNFLKLTLFIIKHGITALMYAAKKKFAPIVHLLLGHRADPNICDEVLFKEIRFFIFIF